MDCTSISVFLKVEAARKWQLSLSFVGVVLWSLELWLDEVSQGSPLGHLEVERILEMVDLDLQMIHLDNFLNFGIW